MPAAHQQPGGFPVDYQAKRASFDLANPEDLYWLTECWVAERRAAIKNIREHGERISQGMLDSASARMSERWVLTSVGNSAAAWIERACTFSAMLMDFRSRQFGRRVLNEQTDERGDLDCHLDWMRMSHDDFKPLSPREYPQALASRVFAGQWLRYLGRLLIHPPGSPPPPTEPFPSCYDHPDWLVRRMVAEFSHCRPCGAFYEHYGSDEWRVAGGRSVCRKPLHCPHCHARSVTRLVKRVENGPWNHDLRAGSRLVLLRLSFASTDLEMSWYDQNEDRDALGFGDWLRTSPPEYTPVSEDEILFHRIECDQEMSYTLTRLEVRRAREVLNELVSLSRDAGIEGGLSFHGIGPRRRNFLHEVSVVGTVPPARLRRFLDAFRSEENAPTIGGFPVECVVFAEGHKDAARLAISGSSWKYDLRRVRAFLNPLASDRCYNRRGEPRGLRGAMAWQPLFLLAGISFWSRWKVLSAMNFKSHTAFGTWRDTLESDRNYLPPVKEKRLASVNRLKSLGKPLPPATRLRLQLKELRVSNSDIARRAGISKSAVSRFMTDGYGSEALQVKLREVLQSYHADRVCPSTPQKVRFDGPESVKSWLCEIGRNSSWLALQLDWPKSKLSRVLNSRIRWKPEFSQLIEQVYGRTPCRRTNGTP